MKRRKVDHKTRQWCDIYSKEVKQYTDRKPTGIAHLNSKKLHQQVSG